MLSFIFYHVLNYFPDETAINTFYYYDKDENLIKFFDDKENLDKLNFLGPGEVVSDSYIINI